jgi:hypothetical protein
VTDESLRAWAFEFGISIEVLLTALVLVYLRREFPKEKSTWILVAQKSMKWLGNQEHAWKAEALPDVEALISKAACALMISCSVSLSRSALESKGFKRQQEKSKRRTACTSWTNQRRTALNNKKKEQSLLNTQTVLL